MLILLQVIIASSNLDIGGANFVLGNYFLRRNYVAFDQDNNQVKLSFFPQADLNVLASYYIGQIWKGANMLLNSLISFFGLVLLGFASVSKQ